MQELQLTNQMEIIGGGFGPGGGSGEGGGVAASQIQAWIAAVFSSFR